MRSARARAQENLIVAVSASRVSVFDIGHAIFITHDARYEDVTWKRRLQWSRVNFHPRYRRENTRFRNHGNHKRSAPRVQSIHGQIRGDVVARSAI